MVFVVPGQAWARVLFVPLASQGEFEGNRTRAPEGVGGLFPRTRRPKDTFSQTRWLKHQTSRFHHTLSSEVTFCHTLCLHISTLNLPGQAPSSRFLV